MGSNPNGHDDKPAYNCDTVQDMRVTANNMSGDSGVAHILGRGGFRAQTNKSIFGPSKKVISTGK